MRLTGRLVYQQVRLPAAATMPVNLLLPPDPILPTTDFRARVRLAAEEEARAKADLPAHITWLS